MFKFKWRLRSDAPPPVGSTFEISLLCGICGRLSTTKRLLDAEYEIDLTGITCSKCLAGIQPEDKLTLVMCADA